MRTRWHMKFVPPASRLCKRYGAKVHYKGILVGEYFVDLLINDVLLVELKTVKALDDAHRMQCTNYLKPTGL
jgi:GxxExxY protein